MEADAIKWNNSLTRLQYFVIGQLDNNRSEGARDTITHNNLEPQKEKSYFKNYHISVANGMCASTLQSISERTAMGL